MTEISKDLLWWITVVDLPALSGLLFMIWRVRNDTNKTINSISKTLDHRCDQLREALSSFKLEVAKNYAAKKDLRAIENRLVEHLLRIEDKLDRTALKAERLNAKSRTMKGNGHD